MANDNPIWWFRLEPALKTLGLGRDAGLSDVEHAYRLHVQRYRPDLYPQGSEKRAEVETCMTRLEEAYRIACDILSHPDMELNNMLEVPKSVQLRDRWERWLDSRG